MSEGKNQPLLIVTGLSGAGLSSALKHLEDLGYEVMDNFPLTLVEPLLEQKESALRPIALGIDTRTRGFLPEAVLETAQRLKARLVFMTCDNAILQKRFTETRRRHPMAKDRPVSAGIEREHTLLQGLQDKADLVIDTTALSIHDLRRVLEGHFGPEQGEHLTVTLMSFGFRNGLPREADIVMDVRFLQNPHWIADLKPLTGKDRKVCDYIEDDENFAPFIENFKGLLEPLLPRYALEGKSYLTIAIGCTGGKHRSVYSVETLAEWVRSLGPLTHVVHRDLG